MKIMHKFKNGGLFFPIFETLQTVGIMKIANEKYVLIINRFRITSARVRPGSFYIQIENLKNLK